MIRNYRLRVLKDAARELTPDMRALLLLNKGTTIHVSNSIIKLRSISLAPKSQTNWRMFTLLARRSHIDGTKARSWSKKRCLPWQIAVSLANRAGLLCLCRSSARSCCSRNGKADGWGSWRAIARISKPKSSRPRTWGLDGGKGVFSVPEAQSGSVWRVWIEDRRPARRRVANWSSLSSGFWDRWWTLKPPFHSCRCNGACGRRRSQQDLRSVAQKHHVASISCACHASPIKTSQWTAGCPRNSRYQLANSGE